MDVKERNQHEHPLTLVDLQLMHQHYVEDDDDYDDNDLLTTQYFSCICNRCARRIDWYHRYYYKCNMPSCDYSLHKFCEEMPMTLQFQGHPSHTLILKKTTFDLKCNACHKYYEDGIGYQCSTCNYGIDLVCATFVEQNTIHHPGHPHPLTSFSVEPGLNKCFACGKKHEGHFYHCITCFNFLINADCLSLPIKLLLQTQQFSHSHLLTLSYSFRDRLYDFECRICGMKLEDEYLIYKCNKCMYYVHPDCATQKTERFMSILLPGLGKTAKNYKDADHPNLVHCPLSDESYILSHQNVGKTYEQVKDEKGQLIHFSHEHPLVMINDEINSLAATASSLMIKPVSLHDPMKRIKLLCNGCSRPITKMPFYKCSRNDDQSCDFVLHEWCTRLPEELNHVGHPQHTLNLGIVNSQSGFRCHVCDLDCNGFQYHCYTCDDYNIDVNCAFIPEEITHQAHANHLLTRVNDSSSPLSVPKCSACRRRIGKHEIYFRCGACDFYLDCRCALYLPKTIWHRLDRHSLQLSYSPITDHKSEYFCEVCEQNLDPGKWFYHCVKCTQSIHSACAPLILQSEQDVNSFRLEGVYKFMNIKFGAIEKKDFHPHPVSFVPGTRNDNSCQACNMNLQSFMIWKCIDCNIAQHSHNCLQDKGSMLAPLIYALFDAIWGDQLLEDFHPETERNKEFYPSEIIRPVTRDWKVED